MALTQTWRKLTGADGLQLLVCRIVGTSVSAGDDIELAVPDLAQSGNILRVHMPPSTGTHTTRQPIISQGAAGGSASAVWRHYVATDTAKATDINDRLDGLPFALVFADGSTESLYFEPGLDTASDGVMTADLYFVAGAGIR
jgi:hypothetical protein